MGLDMYLNATKHISGYDFCTKEEIKLYQNLLTIFDLKDIQTHTPSASVKVTIAYWRKANQIHNWFVKNVQEGVDECQDSYVSREQLNELLEICKKIETDHSLAKTLLPCQSGFFFGSTDYDEYYFEDITNTIKQLESVLNNPTLKDWAFEYHSSW
jgi:hypothetical protein